MQLLCYCCTYLSSISVQLGQVDLLVGSVEIRENQISSLLKCSPRRE